MAQSLGLTLDSSTAFPGFQQATLYSLPVVSLGAKDVVIGGIV